MFLSEKYCIPRCIRFHFGFQLFSSFVSECKSFASERKYEAHGCKSIACERKMFAKEH